MLKSHRFWSSEKPRRGKVSRRLVIFAGVSCSGKSTLIDSLLVSKERQSIFGILQPLAVTSKYEVEKFGFKRPWLALGSTVLHVEINPDPEREARKRWLEFAQAFSEVSLVLVSPTREFLLSNVSKRSGVDKNPRLQEEKADLYSELWLSETYKSFVNNLWPVVTVSKTSIYSNDQTVVEGRTRGEVIAILESIYS